MDDAERREALTKFVRDDWRASPPVFVGRGPVIGDILETAGHVHGKWLSGDRDAGDHGLTRLLRGAPGAGKTALLRHLEELCEGDPGPGRPITVRIGSGALESPKELHRELDEQLERQIPKASMYVWGAHLRRFMAEYVVEVATGSGVAQDAPGWAAGVLAGVAGMARRLLRVDEAGCRALRSLPAPVLVMIDEAQRVRPHSPQAALLQCLHEGAFGDIPVLPVFAGLGYLQQHLGQDGIEISRFAGRAVHTLDPLDETECLSLLKGWLEHFGVEAAATDTGRWGDALIRDKQVRNGGNASLAGRWGEALIRDTQGWPMHITSFLGGLAESLAAADDSSALASANIDAVRRAAAASRSEYNGSRYGGATQAHQGWTGRAMVRLADRGAVEEEDAKAIIRETGPEGGDVPALFASLVERGFLQEWNRAGYTVFKCPIPSLVSHAAIGAARGRWVHATTAIGDSDALRGLLQAGDDIEGRDGLERTPLHIAAECQWADIVAHLLNAGADADAQDVNGKTPKDNWPEYEWPGVGPS